MKLNRGLATVRPRASGDPERQSKLEHVALGFPLARERTDVDRTKRNSLTAPERRHLVVGRKAAAPSGIDCRLLIIAQCIHPGPARLDLTRERGQLFLVLFGPGSNAFENSFNGCVHSQIISHRAPIPRPTMYRSSRWTRCQENPNAGGPARAPSRTPPRTPRYRVSSRP
jgi:hypothetical protein